MTDRPWEGGCHCGAIRFEAAFSQSPTGATPRACDCDYCTRHGAAWLSDPEGRLTLSVPEPKLLSRYRQGSGIADFWVCRRCGVVAAVSYEEGGVLYATVNARALDDADRLGAATPVSPKQLPDSEKIARWKTLWFRDVRVKTAPSSGN